MNHSLNLGGANPSRKTRFGFRDNILKLMTSTVLRWHSIHWFFGYMWQIYSIFNLKRDCTLHISLCFWSELLIKKNLGLIRSRRHFQLTCLDLGEASLSSSYHGMCKILHLQGGWDWCFVLVDSHPIDTANSNLGYLIE